MFNKKLLVLITLVVCLAVVSFLMAFLNSYRRTEEKINVNVTTSANFSRKITSAQFGNTIVFVSSLYTVPEQKRGLSGRESMPTNEGLLFVFPRSDFYGFWMKEMKFPIDIIWIDENSKVVSIARDLKPSSFPEIFKPSEKSVYVLEVNAGFAAEHNIKIGDYVTFTAN